MTEKIREKAHWAHEEENTCKYLCNCLSRLMFLECTLVSFNLYFASKEWISRKENVFYLLEIIERALLCFSFFQNPEILAETNANCIWLR
jgi:hypothetical protein